MHVDMLTELQVEGVQTKDENSESPSVSPVGLGAEITAGVTVLFPVSNSPS